MIPALPYAERVDVRPGLHAEVETDRHLSSAHEYRTMYGATSTVANAHTLNAAASSPPAIPSSPRELECSGSGIDFGLSPGVAKQKQSAADAEVAYAGSREALL